MKLECRMRSSARGESRVSRQRLGVVEQAAHRAGTAVVFTLVVSDPFRVPARASGVRDGVCFAAGDGCRVRRSPASTTARRQRVPDRSDEVTAQTLRGDLEAAGVDHVLPVAGHHHVALRTRSSAPS
jgi:hypothetical protein